MMIVPATISDALNPESVTFRSKTGEGTYTNYSLTNASRGALREEPVLTEMGKTIKRTLPWRLWLSDLSTVSAPAPKHGDQIVDAGNTTYVVDVVDTAFLGQVFDCETYQILS